MTGECAIKVGLICFNPQKVVCDNLVVHPGEFDLSGNERRLNGRGALSAIVSPRSIV